MKEDRKQTVIEEIQSYLILTLDKEIVEGIMERLRLTIEIEKAESVLKQLEGIKNKLN